MLNSATLKQMIILTVSPRCMDFYGNISNFLMDKFSQPPLEKFE